MAANVSLGLAERVRLRARAAGESRSDPPWRYAGERGRAERPMVTLRDGPTGRRAGLIGGPDEWGGRDVARRSRTGRRPDSKLVADGVVSRPQIDPVLAYQAPYPEEIQARVDLHGTETPTAEAR